jgi:hypothetical protein
VVEAALDTWDHLDADSLDAVLAADAGGRASAARLLASGAFDRSAGA